MIPKLPLLRRALILVAVGTIAVGTTACQPKPAAAPAPTPAAAPTGSESAQLISLVNAYRAANGLAGLSEAADATAKAQQHSIEMAANTQLYHSGSLTYGIQDGWTALGENVGVGGSVSQLESMFQASGPHNANLLNGAYNQIGVGVARGADGQLYVTQFFVGR
ncbi:MAG: hypothetical protein QOI95_636 [Acidimicrobiaceae bacterium]